MGLLRLHLDQRTEVRRGRSPVTEPLRDVGEHASLSSVDLRRPSGSGSEARLEEPPRIDDPIRVVVVSSERELDGRHVRRDALRLDLLQRGIQASLYLLSTRRDLIDARPQVFVLVGRRRIRVDRLELFEGARCRQRIACRAVGTPMDGESGSRPQVEAVEGRSSMKLLFLMCLVARVALIPLAAHWGLIGIAGLMGAPIDWAADYTAMFAGALTVGIVIMLGVFYRDGRVQERMNRGPDTMLTQSIYMMIAGMASGAGGTLLTFTGSFTAGLWAIGLGLLVTGLESSALLTYMYHDQIESHEEVE